LSNKLCVTYTRIGGKKEKYSFVNHFSLSVRDAKKIIKTKKGEIGIFVNEETKAKNPSPKTQSPSLISAHNMSHLSYIAAQYSINPKVKYPVYCYRYCLDCGEGFYVVVPCEKYCKKHKKPPPEIGIYIPTSGYTYCRKCGDWFETEKSFETYCKRHKMYQTIHPYL
jgi:hypothetical protein